MKEIIEENGKLSLINEIKRQNGALIATITKGNSKQYEFYWYKGSLVVFSPCYCVYDGVPQNKVAMWVFNSVEDLVNDKAFALHESRLMANTYRRLLHEGEKYFKQLILRPLRGSFTGCQVGHSTLSASASVI